MNDRKPETGAPAPLTPEQKRARDKRNVAIALGLVAFAVLLFLITLVQFDAPNAANVSSGAPQ
jgi:hypothetical protein